MLTSVVQVPAQHLEGAKLPLFRVNQWRHRGGELEEERVRQAAKELGEQMKECASPRKKAARGAGEHASW